VLTTVYCDRGRESRGDPARPRNPFPVCPLHGRRIIREFPQRCFFREENPLAGLARRRRAVDESILCIGPLGQQAELDEQVFRLCAWCVDEGLWMHPVVQFLRRELGFEDGVFELEPDEPDADPMPQQADVAGRAGAVIVPAAVRRRLGRAGRGC